MQAEFETVIRIKPGYFTKSIGVRFDMLCFFRMLEEFGIELGKDISAISKIPYDEMLCVAVYTGMQSYCFEHGKRMKYDKKTVMQWMEDSKITRAHFKTLGGMWNEFMAEYTGEKKKVKEGR